MTVGWSDAMRLRATAHEAWAGESAGAWFLAGFGALGWVVQVGILALQVACVVHVIRRREDYWWIFLILFFPVLGAGVYLFAVVLPEWRRRQGYRAGARPGARGLQGRLRDLEQAVALADTVENRSELAAAYCEDGRYVLARQCYESCLRGLYANDPHLLFGLAKACYGEGDLVRAQAALDRIAPGDMPEYATERELLRAKLLAALGQYEQAVAAFRDVAPRASSPEAWWRLASLLATLGRDGEADDVCRTLLEQTRHMNPVFRRREREWIRNAEQRLRNRA